MGAVVSLRGIMPPLTPEQERAIDEELRRFMAEGREERVTFARAAERFTSASHAIERVFERLTDHERQDEERHGLIMAELRELRAEYRAENRGLAARVDKLEESDEDTSKHNIDRLNKEIDRSWDKWKIVVGALIGLITGGVLTLVAFLLRR